MKRVLAICMVLMLVLGCMPLSRAYAADIATVKGGWLKLRAAASFDGKVLGRYYTGEQVALLGSYGSWYRVRTSDGKTGYMHGDYLSIKGGSIVPITGGTMYVTSENGKGVRLRTGPGTDYSAIATYAVGTKATVISLGSQWCYVCINGHYGYMMAQFLTSSVPSITPPAVYTANASIASKNGRSVNVRTGAGKGYPVLGTYAVGTKVSALSLGREWSRIQVSGKTGYVMTQFLSGFSAKVHSSNGGAVAMRSGAGKSYNTLTSWPVGTKVQVLNYASDWCYVSVNDWSGYWAGYMMTKFLVF